MALALGLGSLFNHSDQPNVSFKLNTQQYTIEYTTFRPIQQGEELCIFYGHQATFGDDQGQVEVGASTLTPEEEEKDLVFGGLAGLQLDGDGEEQQEQEGQEEQEEPKPQRTEEQQRAWDNEIIPFDQLDWRKVTNLVEPEDLPLTTCKLIALSLLLFGAR